MAIQKIQRFGTYTPSPINESRARKMEQLAGLARGATNFARTLSEEKAARKAPEEALEDVKKAEETNGEIKLRSRFERGSEVYNTTLQQAYINSKEISFNEANSKLAAEFANDLSSYTNAINAHKEVVLSNLDDNFKNQIEQNINAIQSQTSSRIYANEVTQNLKAADDLSKFNIDVYSDLATTQASEGNYEDALKTQETINKIFDERVKNNQETAASVQAKKNKLSADIDAQVIRFQVDKELKENGAIAAVKFIQDIQNAKNTVFTVTEKDALLDTLKADVNQYISLQDTIDTEAEEVLKDQQDRNTMDFLIQITENKAKLPEINNAAREGLIDETGYKSLLTILSTRGQGIDDYDVILSIQNDLINNPKQAEQTFLNGYGKSFSDKTAQFLNKSIQDSLNKQSLLQTQEVKRFKQVLADQFITVGQYGAKIEEAQKAKSSMLFAFDERVLAGENPRDVARDLIQIREISKLAGLTFEESAEVEIEKYKADFKKKPRATRETQIDLYNKKIQAIKEKYLQMENFQKYLDIVKDLKGEI